MHPLIRLARFIRIDSVGRIVAYAIASALFCAAVAVGVLSLFFAFLPYFVPPYLVFGILAAAAGIALFIALPVSAILLVMLRLIADAVSRLDAHVRRDPLTGVMTRAAFLHAVQAHCGDGGAFLMIDADRFKSLNDAHGHAAGDEALRLIASAIEYGADRDAAVGRLGGEEFGVWIPGAGPETARETAIRIVKAVRRTRFDPGRGSVPLTVSVGVAAGGRGATPGVLMKHADEALYAAKRDGRDRYSVFRPVPAGMQVISGEAA